MRDLALWRMMDEPAADASRLASLLREAADLPLEERGVFVGRAPQLAAHDDPNVRRAVVRLLRGSTGLAAWRLLVDALDDDDMDVRQAAVSALAVSCVSEPFRWAHALFHPQADVRAAALRESPPAGYTWMLLYLAADPHVGGLALARVQETLRANEQIPATTLPVILQLVASGTLDAPAARELVAGITLSNAAQWLYGLPGRSESEVSDALALAAMPLPADSTVAVHRLRTLPSRDGFDGLIELFWPDERPEPHTPAALAFDDACRRFFETWRVLLLSNDVVFARRFVAATLAVAARKTYWIAEAAELCCLFHPQFLVLRWVPREVRRDSAGLLYSYKVKVPPQPGDAIREALASDAVRDPFNGRIDLWVVGGLLHILEKDRFVTVTHWLGESPIVANFLDDPERHLPFLSVPDTSEAGRQRLVREIAARMGHRQAWLYGLLVTVVAADGLEFLDPLGVDDAVHVADELLTRSDQGRPPTSKRTRAAAAILGHKIAQGGGDPFLRFVRLWLARPNPEKLEVGLEIFAAAAREMDNRPVVGGLASLELPLLKRLLPALECPPGLPYGKELKLLHELKLLGDDEISRWVRERLPATSPESEAARAARRKGDVELFEVDEALASRIASCREGELPAVLVPCLERPHRGLCAALARRTDPSGSESTVCAALLGSHDPLDEIDREFARFGVPARSFCEEIDRQAMRHWHERPHLPLLGNAWLNRWEKHAFAFIDEATAAPRSLCALLESARGFASPVVIREIVNASQRALLLWRYRDHARFAAEWTHETAAAFVELLDSPGGADAAGMLVRAHTSGLAPALMEGLKPAVAEKLPDLTTDIRVLLQEWIETRGYDGPPVLRRPVRATADPAVLAQIARCHDLELLERWCCDPNATVAEEAAMRLLELGEPGMQRLMGLLRREPPPPAAPTVASTTSLWPAGPSRDAARDFVTNDGGLLHLRFLAGLGLIRQGDAPLRDVVLDIACRPAEVSWFRAEDWQALLDAGIPERRVATALAVSPHPRAYQAAVQWLTSQPTLDDEIHAALVRFLDAGSDRMWHHRSHVAWWLQQRRDFIAFPILLKDALRNIVDIDNDPKARLLASAPRRLLDETVDACLVAGNAAVPEAIVVELLLRADRPIYDVEGPLQALLVDCTTDIVRTRIVEQLKGSLTRRRKLARVADNFAWGQRIARELTGRMYSIEMLAGDDLGYTRLNEDRIHINVMPLLRAERNGRDVVQALILHELGHHLYHRGAEPEALWEQAARDGIGPLLNLTADEHLERNIRATSTPFGDRLKRLAAYAFQHAKQEMAVGTLLDALRERAFDVLTRVVLRVARKPHCVLVDNGEILTELERRGSSFARFVRAMRMGLGNRHGDPKVEQGLALFKGRFRHSDMAKLVDIARQLREIFGDECALLGCLGQDAILGCDAGELLAGNEGISQDEISQEIQRITNPRKRPSGSSSKGSGSGRWINVGPDEQFDHITNVVPMSYDPAQHRSLADKVASPARHLRRFLQDLGQKMIRTRMRMRGRLDRTRLTAVVTRNDPRMLAARERLVHNDLFIAAVIDCSGSMGYGSPVENMEKAKLFGAVLAEACKDLDNVDARFFGFTDTTIYDAGDAGRPAVHALEAGGGNNDAAGLYHAARIALASRRKAKVLVMISDGLPTECSVQALKGLVRTLSRKGVCCAQVAVQPLEEICFPNYVLLNQDDPFTSVRDFGRLIARLVKRTLGGA